MDGMERRSFGDGTRVSVFGVGCGRVGSLNNPVSMREIEATLQAAIEAGVNLFDTADIYGQGDSERTLSRLLRRHRDRMFVVTKVGGRHGRHAGAIRLAKPLLRLLLRSRPRLRGTAARARAATVGQNFRPPDLRRAVEGSRRRLGLERLDGLLLHDPSLETLRDPEIHDFLGDLLRKGQVAHAGASVTTLHEIEAALAVPSITLLQIPLAVAAALAGTPILETIRRRDVGVFVREVLAGTKPGGVSPREAVATAIAPDFVTAAIVGVSTRHHLTELLSAIS
jgi:aryl-alcohol dehydrogenase-like predicted oxidoreductase